MSTDYMLLKKIRACDLFDGRLEQFKVYEHIVPDGTTATEKFLSDGRNGLCVYIDDDGYVTMLTRYGANAPGKILRSIADAFDVDIVSEHEPQFWGFDTQQEWDDALKKFGDEAVEQFYVEILKHLRGEENDIRPGTVGESKVRIAEGLVAHDPTLMLVENKERLLNAIYEIYERDHVVRVTLSEADKAAAIMMNTHEDDLPQT